MATDRTDRHAHARPLGIPLFFFENGRKGRRNIRYPYQMDAYKLLWAMFYEQQEHRAKAGSYLLATKDFPLGDSERKALPAGSEIGMEATSSQYRVWITLPSEGVRYVLNHEGRFQIEKL